jgi:uncharacterized SAM-binding protein YcdF (DUF218 family)
MAAQGRNRRRSSGGHPFRTLFVLFVIVALVWFASVYARIDRVANEDQAQPSDAIAVFGAAQYVGHPSPVYHARLDHAVSLYKKQMAPVIITLGGSGDDRSGQTEGAVGRDYLLGQGVPFDHIIAETQSVDTEQQAQLLAAIAHDRGFKRIIVVSDATHLFRIRALCQQQGLSVLTSPRPAFGNLSRWGHITRVTHEMLSYTFMRLHLEAGWAKRWIESREES